MQMENSQKQKPGNELAKCVCLWIDIFSVHFLVEQTQVCQ